MPVSKDPLFQPLRIGHLRLKNRIMSTSHAAGLGDGGKALERYQAYHEEKARGGLALTMFGGSTNVSPDSPNTFMQLSVGDDSCIEWLQAFSERIHRHGAAIMVQITHLGRRGDAYADHWLPMIAPSPVRETLHRAFPREMDQHDIDRVIRDFAAAARRCKEGGLDGLETLAGGHLIGQFLSPVTNKRTDGYGGSLANRCRFGLEVYDAIRKAVGDDFLVGFRFIVDEGLDGGLSAEECLEIAHRFERSGTLDFFNAVYGRMDTAHGLAVDNMPGMYSPLAPWLAKAAAFRQAVKLPVFHAARIADVATARHAIAEGLIDMAGMTRAHIADPHLVAKLERGEADRIRPCVGATHCMGPTRPVCIHNAATGRETTVGHDIPKVETPRRAVVVGGGPAGLEAARVLATRGHMVTLLEAAPHVGGQLRLATAASWRRDVSGIIDWRIGELDALGAEVRCNVYAGLEDVTAFDPDIVILATGGVPDVEWCQGHELATSAWDALTGEVPAAGDVLVYDGTGRHPAVTVAERYSMAGRRVEIVAIDDMTSAELGYAERVIWKKRLYQLGVPVSYDRELVKLARAGNRIAATFVNLVTDEQETHIADHVVVERGTVPVNELFEGLRPSSRNDGVTDIDALVALKPQPCSRETGFELHRIGDAAASRNIAAAIYDALRLCRTL